MLYSTQRDFQAEGAERSSTGELGAQCWINYSRSRRANEFDETKGFGSLEPEQGPDLSQTLKDGELDGELDVQEGNTPPLRFHDKLLLQTLQAHQLDRKSVV